MADIRLPTPAGEFRLLGYWDGRTGREQLALVSGVPPAAGAPVRIHRECRAGETLRSARCDCAARLERALATLAAEGGVLVYLRAGEGTLLDRLAGYQRQDAAGAPSLPVCAPPRDYDVAAEILADLGVGDIVLLSEDPAAPAALTAHGVRVAGPDPATERVPRP